MHRGSVVPVDSRRHKGMGMLIQPVLRPVLQPVLRSIFDPGIGGVKSLTAPIWTPASLFAASEQGVWLDESDLSTMFQDLAGTVPAAVDSPVGKRLDKSGNGNHWAAPNTSARPILRLTGGLYSLQWDGVDDQQLMPAGAWTLVTCYFAGYLNNPQGVHVWDLANPSGGFFGAYGSGSTNAPNLPTVVGSPTYKVDGTDLAPVTRVRLYTLMFNQNTILETQTLTLPTSGGLSIAGYSGFVFKGFSSGEVMRNSNLTSDEAAQLRTWLSAKQGRVL